MITATSPQRWILSAGYRGLTPSMSIGTSDFVVFSMSMVPDCTSWNIATIFTAPIRAMAVVAELASESIGIAAITAQQLPTELGASVVQIANTAFVDAMTTGFQISAAILMTAVVIAFTLIPNRMRTEQAGAANAAVQPVFTGEPTIEPAAA